MTGIPQTRDPLDFLDPPQQADPLSFLDPVRDSWAEEAQGFGEKLKFQGAAAGKALGDGFTNVASLIYKAGAGAWGAAKSEGLFGSGGAAMSVSDAASAIGKGFNQGIEGVNQQFEQTYGTSDPSILDLFGTRDGQASVGRQADELIQRRLGQSALFGQSLGAVASFMLPGGVIGKGAAAAARPMAAAAERVLAKAALTKAGVGSEKVAELLRTGNAWGYIASNPQVARSLNVWGKLAKVGGGSPQQVLEATAANIAQVYALSPDDERVRGALVAGLTSPFMVPIANLGQSLGRSVMEMGLGEKQALAIKNAYGRFEQGRITPMQLSQQIATEVPQMAKIGAGLVSGAFESPAMLALDPNAWPVIGRALGGDADAWGELQAMTLGTAAGIVGAKMMLPPDTAAMFKSYYPSLNRVDTYLEAEAAKRTLQEPQKPSQAAHPVADPAAQERFQPNSPRGMDDQGLAERLGVDQQFDRTVAELRAQYGWADQPTVAALRGNWEPSFPDRGSSDVHLTYNGGHNVFLSGGGEGPLKLTVSDATEAVLRDFGMQPGELGRTVLAPGRIQYEGQFATKVLDDLALIGGFRRMQLEATYQRLGFREAAPGTWVDGEGYRYLPQIDGMTRVLDPEGKFVGTQDVMAVGDDPLTQVWDAPVADTLQAWVAKKQNLSPDPLVDNIVMGAVQQARYGTGEGARRLRDFFSITDPQSLMSRLRPGEDRVLAMELASLGSATEVPTELAAKTFASEQQVAADAQAAPADRADYMRSLQEGVPASDPERVARNSYMEAMDELAKQPGVEAEIGADMKAKAVLGDQSTGDAERTFAKRQTEMVDDAVRSADDEQAAKNAESVVGQYRRSLAEAIEAAKPNDKTARVALDPATAAVLQKWVPQTSDLRPQIDAVIGGQVGEVTVSGRDLTKLSREWGKWSKSPALRESVKARKADEFIVEAARGMGIDVESPSYKSLSKRISDQKAAPKQEPAAEAGGVSDVGAALARDVMRTLTSPRGKRTARRIADEAFTRQTEVVTRLTEKSDPTLGRDLRKSVSGDKPQIEGQAKSLLTGAREALKRLSKAQPRTLVDRVKNTGRWEHEMVDIGNGMQRARWEMLVDGKEAPRNADEKAFVESMQSSLKYLWGEAAKAGMTRQTRDPKTGDIRVTPIKVRDSSVVPFVAGKDVDAVMGDAALRRAYFDDVANANPDVKTQGDKGERPITGEDLEAEFIEAEAKAGKGGTSEALSALDFTRRFKNLGHVWRGHEMRNQNPLSVMESQTSRQSARIATVRNFGEDYSPDVRKAAIKSLAADPEAAAAVEQLSTKPGLDARVEQAVRGIDNLGDRDLNRSMQDFTREVAKRSGGAEPIKASKFLTWLDPIERVARPFSTRSSWVLDLGEFVTRPLSYGTAKDLLRGVKMIAESKGEAVALMRQQGAMETWMSDHVFSEATNVWAKLADFVSIPGSLTETGKQTLFGYMGKAMLERWSQGSRTAVDRDVLVNTLKYSPEQAEALLSGKAPDVLQKQFVREWVSLLASRRSTAESSRWSASPNVNRMFRYVRWATNRMTDTLTSAKNVISAGRENGWTSPEARFQYRRFVRLTTGTAIGGVVGQMMAYAIADAFRGENGFARFARELTQKPIQTVLKATAGQMVGGPIAQFFGAVKSEDPEKGILRTVPVVNTPAQALVNGYEIVKAFADGDPVKGRQKAVDWLPDTAADIGLWPRTEVNALIAGIKGEREGRNYDMRAREFEKAEGVTHPFGSRYRPQEFYDAVATLYKTARNAGTTQEALTAATEELKQALAIAPGESVAASIEGHQRMKHWTNEQRTKFIEVHGSDTFEAMARQDRMLRDFAKEVRKFEGTNPSKWEEDLESVRKQTLLGATDRWRGFVERTLDEAAQQVLSGEAMPDRIDTIAEAMSAYPELLADQFDDRTRKFMLSGNADSLAIARRIRAIYRNRVMERVREGRREAAKERRDG